MLPASPSDSAILYLTFGTDAQGGAYADERVLADLHATANAPVFAAHSVYLGSWRRRRDDCCPSTTSVAARRTWRFES